MEVNGALEQFLIKTGLAVTMPQVGFSSRVYAIGFGWLCTEKRQCNILRQVLCIFQSRVPSSGRFHVDLRSCLCLRAWAPTYRAWRRERSVLLGSSESICSTPHLLRDSGGDVILLFLEMSSCGVSALHKRLLPSHSKPSADLGLWVGKVKYVFHKC